MNTQCKLARLTMGLLLCGAAPLPAQNAYDVAGRVISPALDMFLQQSRSGNRAMDARLSTVTVLDSGASLQAEIDLKVQYPNMLRMDAHWEGRTLVVCRVGQTVWAWPRAEAEALLAQVPASASAREVVLPSYQLPVPDAQAVLLPALLAVADRGTEEINGASQRVLDLRLQPEIAKSSGLGAHSATVVRVWSDPERDFRPRRLGVRNPAWTGTVEVEALDYHKALPQETWQPTPEQAPDVLEIPASTWAAVVEQYLN